MPATQPYKAVAAFALTFLGTLLASIQGRKEFGDLTALEWLIVIGTALVTTGAVYGITNPPTGRRRNDLGQTNVIGAVLGVLLIVLLVFLILRLA